MAQQENPIFIHSFDMLRWLLLSLATALVTYMSMQWQYAVAITLFVVLTIYWRTQFNIHFYKKHLVYTRLFRSATSIQYSEIEAVEFKSDSDNGSVNILYSQQQHHRKLTFELGDSFLNISLKDFLCIRVF